VVEVGFATATLPGEQESGDLHVVEPYPGGMLVAAIDGLGHGPDAASASRMACETLREEPGADLPDLFVRCHGRLSRSRGVVMSLAQFSEEDPVMRWLGVGNVEAALVRAASPARADSILLLGGVVGYQLPRLRPSTTDLEAGDIVILATDGIRHGFLHGVDPERPPQQLADGILASHRKENDDALVVVARYAGAAA
jgi:phosphoserine phosphatase RsbX